MLLNAIVSVSRDVAATRSRLRKRALLSDCLRAAGVRHVTLVVNYLTGTLPQGRIGLGPAILRGLDVGTGEAPTLSLHDVDATFARIGAISGKGSQQARRDELAALFGRATADERRFLEALIVGELRQGALEGVLIDAIADAADLPAQDVRRAVMLAGDVAGVADAALGEGHAGLAQFRLTPLSPVRPMLAQPAENMDAALAALGEAALEYKIDGARVQIHRVDEEVKVYTRQLNDVTASVPEVVEAALALPARRAILDGEVIALHEDGRPLPFQVTMRRFGRKADVDGLRGKLPLSVFAFDALLVDDDALIDLPLYDRAAALAALVPEGQRVPRQVSDDPLQARRFLTAALESGHEGVMAKALTSPYAAGNRGADWLKIKQAHTLDLVVLAAEWGSGRRKGWLSNLHLGARDAQHGGFVMLGKTFKGLTDRLLKWQTDALLAREIGREGPVVHVRPELVVEIAVNDIQASSQYPAGMALRFARVKRYRDDKPASEADTVQQVRGIFEAQVGVAAGGRS